MIARRKSHRRFLLIGAVTCGFALAIGAAGAQAVLATWNDRAAHGLGSRPRDEGASASRRPAVPAKLMGLPAPVLGTVVDAFPVKGVVLVKLSVTLHQGRGFVPLTSPRQIPLGAELDTTRGVVKLETATASSGVFQSGEFGGGVFRLAQGRSLHGLTELQIIDSRSARRSCATLGKRAAIARRHLSARVLGLLRADDHGHFTTRGQYSAATVRGTAFSVIDRCDGTFTAVKRGELSVRDFVRRRTLTLLAGQVYFAAAVALTGEASAITQSSAHLSGVVIPNGSEVTGCAFEYGLTPSYGQTALCSSLPGGGFSPVQVMATLTGLPANSTIHFRAIAANRGGTTTGADDSFKTLPLPPLAGTGGATQITASTATLQASIAFFGAPPTECQFEYGPSTLYGATAPCSPVSGASADGDSVFTMLSNLVPNSTVHFRIIAASAGGVSTGHDEAFQTSLGHPSVVLGEPTEVTTSAATLNATVNANGGEFTSCEFEFGSTAAYGEAAPCSVMAGHGTEPVRVSAQIAGLLPSETLHFRVFAANREGISETADQTVQTLPVPLDPLTGLSTEVTSGSARLHGSIAPPGAEITSCEFQYGPTEAYGNSAPCSLAPPSGEAIAASALISGLSPMSTYHFRFVAANRNSTRFSVDSTINTAPSKLRLSDSFLESPVGKTIVVTAKVQEVPSIAGVRVRFVVTGGNPQAAERLTNEVGEATFEYEGFAPGEDHIRASIISGGEEFASELTATWELVVAASPPAPPEHRSPRRRVFSPPTPEPRIGTSASRESREPGRSVIASLISGRVLVRLPSGKWVSLTGARTFRAGSKFDTRRGVVNLVALGSTKRLEEAEVDGGVFRIARGSARAGLTQLDIVDTRSPHHCGAHRVMTLGGLNLNSRGTFTAWGRFSAAVTHNAVVSVLDRCDGTLTLATAGKVAVHDFARNTTVTLHSGQRYLARASGLSAAPGVSELS